MARGRKKAKIYEFERLLDIRDQEIEDGPQKGDREIRYLVKWKGFGPQHDSWEPASCFSTPEALRSGIDALEATPAHAHRPKHAGLVQYVKKINKERAKQRKTAQALKDAVAHGEDLKPLVKKRKDPGFVIPSERSVRSRSLQQKSVTPPAPEVEPTPQAVAVTQEFVAVQEHDEEAIQFEDDEEHIDFGDDGENEEQIDPGKKEEEIDFGDEEESEEQVTSGDKEEAITFLDDDQEENVDFGDEEEFDLPEATEGSGTAVEEGAGAEKRAEDGAGLRQESVGRQSTVLSDNLDDHFSELPSPPPSFAGSPAPASAPLPPPPPEYQSAARLILDGRPYIPTVTPRQMWRGKPRHRFGGFTLPLAPSRGPCVPFGPKRPNAPALGEAGPLGA